jgi:hypothetical protein
LDQNARVASRTVGRQRLAHVGLAVGLAVWLLVVGVVGVVALPGVEADSRLVYQWGSTLGWRL